MTTCGKRLSKLMDVARKKGASNEQGAELAEFALVVPLLFTMLLGIFWFARAYNIYETITRAAREGVRFAVAPNCAACGNKLPTDTEIQNVINNSLRASALDPARTNPNPITIARTPIGGGGGTPPDIDVAVSFSYPYQFYLPFTSLNMSNVNISTTVHMRQEQ
jgi:Flp pilus assembly protein TadG